MNSNNINLDGQTITALAAAGMEFKTLDDLLPNFVHSNDRDVAEKNMANTNAIAKVGRIAFAMKAAGLMEELLKQDFTREEATLIIAHNIYR